MTIEELGRTTKEKFPEYAEQDDFAVGKAIISKYPSYGSLIDFDPPPEEPAKSAFQSLGEFFFGRTAKLVGTPITLALLAANKGDRERLVNSSPEEFSKRFPFLEGKVDSSAGNVALRTAGEGIGAAAEQSMLTKLPGGATALGRIGQGAALGGTAGLGTGLAEGRGARGTIASTATGAAVGGLVSGAVEGARAILASPKVASFFTNTKQNMFAKVKSMNKADYSKAKQFLQEPASMPEIADDIFQEAKKLRVEASSAWEIDEEKVLKGLEGKVDDAMLQVRSGVGSSFIDDGIGFTDGKIDVAGTKFSKDTKAKRVLTNVMDILDEPVKGTESLMTKRMAIANQLESVPLENRSLRRTLTMALDSYDAVINDATGGAMAQLRESWAKKVGPVDFITKKMGDSRGNFDPDKGGLFVKQAMSDLRFTKSAVLAQLDEVAGTHFAKQVSDLGAVRAVAQLKPPTGSRVYDVMVVAGLNKVPLLSALFSPTFWGSNLVGKAGATQAGIGLAQKLGILGLEKIANLKK